MNTVQLIKKKRDGGALTSEELRFLIEGYTRGDVPDYQMSAFLMAVFYRGMTREESALLVSLMAESGDRLSFPGLSSPKVDKHSTGGIGDKTTLILAPLLASCGLAYPTLSGRGLGHTGGTLDKLEAIPGFDCFLGLRRYEELVASTGLAFLGQTESICPADRRMYALRDVTGTVESIPLIVASIMSKKLAEGIDGIVFDVKCGSGAFMKTEPAASALAHALVSAAHASGKTASALVTDMGEPLGHAVGNAIEVNECVSYMRRGPNDPAPDPRLHALVMELGAELLAVGELRKGNGRPPTRTAWERIERALASGEVYAKFLEIVRLQGGDAAAVERGLPLAPEQQPFLSPVSGFLRAMDGEAIGMALIELGGGRHLAGDSVDPGVGFWFEQGVGAPLNKGDSIARIFARDAASASAARKLLERAVEVGPEAPTKPHLIRQRI